MAENHDIQTLTEERDALAKSLALERTYCIGLQDRIHELKHELDYQRHYAGAWFHALGEDQG